MTLDYICYLDFAGMGSVDLPNVPPSTPSKGM